MVDPDLRRSSGPALRLGALEQRANRWQDVSLRVARLRDSWLSSGVSCGVSRAPRDVWQFARLIAEPISRGTDQLCQLPVPERRPEWRNHP
jgi:hypothetical protein